jgi:hypothetical protein
MAANVENPASADSEAYIEKYLRSVLAVENLLTLDRLRQVSQWSAQLLWVLTQPDSVLDFVDFPSAVSSEL